LLASLLFLLLMRKRRRLESDLPERTHPALMVTSFLRSEEPLPRNDVLRLLEALRYSGLVSGRRLGLSVLALRFLARGALCRCDRKEDRQVGAEGGLRRWTLRS
jgi:hypothetical protein